MRRRRDIAVYSITLFAALGVGVLIGRSACAPEPERVVETKVVERTPACPPCDVAEADVGEADVAGGSFERRSPDEETDQLPEAPPPTDPADRKKLLAWVQDQSRGLRRCRPDATSSVRLTVTLKIGEEGAVERASLNAPEEEVSRQVLSCLRRRIGRWKPPPELVRGRNEIVFGLDL